METPMMIIVLPLTSDRRAVAAAVKGINSVFTAKIEVKKPPLIDPLDFLDSYRGQLRADDLLSELRKRYSGNPLQRILAIVDGDGYVTGLNFVFGIASPGWGGIVFTERLRPEFYGRPPHELLFAARLVKECLHELGHSLGLGHCPDKRCVMSFSNTIMDVDRKAASFCARCRMALATSYPGLLRGL